MFILYSLLTEEKWAMGGTVCSSITNAVVPPNHWLSLPPSSLLITTCYLIERIRKDQTGCRCLLFFFSQPTLTYSAAQLQFLLCSYQLLLPLLFYLSFVCCYCPDYFYHNCQWRKCFVLCQEWCCPAPPSRRHHYRYQTFDTGEALSCLEFWYLQLL